MLQLQERLDDAMCAKEEEWGHVLEEPVTGKTKQRVRLTPPKLRLIREMLNARDIKNAMRLDSFLPADKHQQQQQLGGLQQ